MLYHQKQQPFYCPELVRVSIGLSDITVNYAEALDQSCVEFLHTHDCFEIYYCLSGTQHIHVDGSTQTLSAGNLILIRPGVSHHTVYEPNHPKTYVVFVFTPPTVSAAKAKVLQPEDEILLAVQRYFEDHPFFVCQDAFDCVSILDRLGRELAAHLPGKAQMVALLYQQYLLSALRNFDTLLPTKVGASNSNLAIEITKYMHANYYNNLTMQDIARVFFVSPRHINRVFEDYFGQSFKRTLNIYRLNYAKNYFLDTDFSVEKVAAMVGFSSPKMLYQMFREIEGMTIAEFRASHKGQSAALSRGM